MDRRKAYRPIWETALVAIVGVFIALFIAIVAASAVKAGFDRINGAFEQVNKPVDNRH